MIRVRGLAIAAILLVPGYAAAQPYAASATPRAGSIEIGGGVVWTGGYDAGSDAATER